jgi:hypothetical protein
MSPLQGLQSILMYILYGCAYRPASLVLTFAFILITLEILATKQSNYRKTAQEIFLIYASRKCN